MLDWDKLKLFYQVANAGSITIAAQKLNISQPALSRSMLNLEARIRKKLFNRHKRGITLTREGEILYRGAHKMFMESRNIENSLREGSDSIEGDMTIMTTPAIGSTWLMKYLPRFLDQYPKLRIKIIGVLSEGNINDADILIRPYMSLQPTLIQRHLTSFHMCLFASHEYIEKFGMPKTPEELDNHRLITFGGDSFHPLGNINWILNVGRIPGSVRESFLVINSTQGLLRAAEQGLGIVELGKGYPALEGVDLVEVLPEIEGPVVDVFYIYSEHKKSIRKITALYDYLLESSKTSEIKSSYAEVHLKNEAVSLG